LDKLLNVGNKILVVSKPHLECIIKQLARYIERSWDWRIRENRKIVIDEGLVLKNPCRKIRMLKENNVRDRVLKVPEIEILFNELNPLARRIVETAYHTGMRKA
jgi:hypothetical protein